MGRMKDIYIQMLEEQYGGDPNEYLKKVVAEYATASFKNSKILCPNCLNSELDKCSDNIECFNCGQKFILVENSLRFK